MAGSYELNAVAIDGTAMSLSKYAGKVSLVVNVVRPPPCTRGLFHDRRAHETKRKGNDGSLNAAPKRGGALNA